MLNDTLEYCTTGNDGRTAEPHGDAVGPVPRPRHRPLHGGHQQGDLRERGHVRPGVRQQAAVLPHTDTH